jgi:predicted dehydrogenase
MKNMAPANGTAIRTSLPRVAVIGCGAAAREYCLPMLAKFPDFRGRIIAVDKNASQAAAVANEFGIQSHCTDYQNLPFEIDAAIVTTPHHLHAEQSIHFLRQGTPVFVEKPMGMSSSEVTQMLAAAAEGGTTLMVNNCRRLFPAYRRVQELLSSGEYGDVLRITISDGSPFEWNSVSSFYLRDARQARGVFLDRGAHTVDIVDWWLPDRPHVVNSQYDAMGGAEALMKVQLACGNTDVQLTFSRLYKLENAYSIECERARIRGRLFQSTKFEVERQGRVEPIQAGKPVLYHEYAWQLLENFIEVVQGMAPPLFTAADVAPSIALIDDAYRLAERFELPWYDDDPNLLMMRGIAKTYSL